MTETKRQGGLGFKEIQSVNLTLLAKQVWRFLMNPNLLVSKVLRAKYYKNLGLLKAKIPKNKSWFWRRIVAAREIIEKGMRKRVGDGQTINIWNDR